MSKALEPQSLETYLAQIAHELRALPASARADEMREIEAHLRALVQAGQQLEDISKAEATTVGLRQFGSPRAIGRNLRRAWERKQPEAWWRAGLALTFALGFFAIVVIPFMQGFYAFHLNFHGVDTSVPQADAKIVAIYGILATYSQFFSFFFMVFTTYVMGLISPKRSKWVISSILAYLLVPIFFSSYPNTSLFVSILAVNLVTAAMGGTYLGSRHGRRLLSRIAKAN